MKNDHNIVQSVIRVLGTALIILIAGLLGLTYVVVGQGNGAKTVDPAAVGAVGAIATLAGTIGGYVGGLLSSARTGPVAVEAVNTPDNPVPTEPVVDPGN